MLQTVNVGARLAEPGEFTRRAFLNGRIDLSQAEAVADIIRARTDEARRLALRQLDGSLTQEIAALRHDLIGAAAAIEVSIDFSEEVGDLNYPELELRLEAVLSNINRLLAESHRGKALRDGLSVALAGRPNVGKSSLMNALLRAERAIVTPFAGTTRDRIDEQLQIEGIAVTLSDTAGLRDATDPVERIGVERAKDAVIAADLALFVVDASVGITEEDRSLAATASRAGNVVILLTKCDLITQAEADRLAQVAAQQLGLNATAVECVSATGNPAIEGVERQIAVAAGGTGADFAGSVAMVSNVRHIQALQSAAKNVALALESARQRMPGDFAAIDVRGALNALGLITGETVTEDIIHRIFEDFCVGK
jgi:tRNA modification GTPase